ncbi:MAG: hypothetical protein JSU73_02850 [candidate division WOR-3 bacterium]|nr:MAG: hypothetical protein JSU73_02850 [candidate division WOR-3 bacterium]
MNRAFVCLLVTSALTVPVAWATDAAVPVTVSPKPGLDSEDITIPRLLSYQGRLTDTDGDPVPDSTWSVQFALYQDSAGQVPFWSETQDVVTSSGLFSVLLGAVRPVRPVPASGSLYLGMKVGGEREMQPRVRLVSSPYAFLARKADTAEFARYALVRDSVDGDLAVAGELRGHGSARFGPNCAANDSFSLATGLADTANGNYSASIGGRFNSASGQGSFIGGGFRNRATQRRATILGGQTNQVSAADACVVGGVNCAVSSYGFATNSGSEVIHGNSSAFNGQTTTSANELRCGILSKAGGSFTIDHPTDPHGMILNHYFVESPEMRNVYEGEAVLDATGRAEVELPDYFSALNRSPRVQLTGVGTHEVHVAEDVTGNRFAIGGKPGTRVYWMVTGERRDVSAEAIRRVMPVEQTKTGALAGQMLDDEFLAGCMVQLEREGKAQGVDFRTAAGRQRYERMRRVLETGR